MSSLVYMVVVNIYDAKTQLSSLIAKVEQGEEVVIARAGRPVARLVPLETPVGRVPGRDKGAVRYDDDFHDALPAEVAETFEG